MTRDDRALRLLRQDRELADIAAFPFDFDLDRAEHGEAVRLASGAGVRAIAGDDTGGTYFLCSEGEVLYASSEGEAGLLGDSVDEALEVLIGLPGWRDFTAVDPLAGDAELTAEAARSEDDIRSYVPRIGRDRDRFLVGLGLRKLPPLELIRRLHRALLRTEPDFLLLDGDEGGAYALLDRLPRPPLWQTVLAPGRDDIALLRSDRTRRGEVTDDPARRATLLRAAQYDRQAADLPLLRILLRAEAQLGDTEELRLAAVLVGLYGHAEDYELIQLLGAANPDVYYELGDFPETADGLSEWATAFDVSNYGQDPADEHELTWGELARRQGRTELARCILLRLLDDAGPRDGFLLGLLAGQLTRLGDFPQAVRAQHLHACLQDDPGHRGASLLTLASLQRRAGDAEAAWQTLQRAVVTLDGPPPTPPTDQLAFDLDLDIPEPARHTVAWRELQLAHRVAEEHLLVARTAAGLALSAIAHAALAAGNTLLSMVPRPAVELRQLAQAVAEELANGER